MTLATWAADVGRSFREPRFADSSFVSRSLSLAPPSSSQCFEALVERALADANTGQHLVDSHAAKTVAIEVANRWINQTLA